MIKLPFTCFLILTTLLLQGCAVTAIGTGIAAVEYADAKQTEAKQSCQKNYNDYLKVAKNPIPLSEYCANQ